MRRGLFGSILLTLLDAGPAARHATAAEPYAGRGEKLDWTAPVGCPTRDHVVAEISRIAGERIQREFHAKVSVLRGAGEYRAHIVLQVGAGLDERDVEGATCVEIAEASALLIALALEPEPEPPSGPEPPSAKRPKGPLRARAARPASMRLHTGVAVGLEILALPRPVSTLRPSVAISSGRLMVGVEGFVSPSVSEDLAREPRKGADFWLFGAKLAGCWMFGASALRAGPCAGVGVMGIHAKAFGVSRPRDTSTWTPNLTAEARFVWTPRPRFEGIVAVVIGVPAERLDFVVDSTAGSRQLFQSPPMTLSIGIGLARFCDVF